MKNSAQMVVTMTAGDLQRMLEEQRKAILADFSAVLAQNSTHAGICRGADEICSYLGISRATFYSLYKRGVFGDAVKHIGRGLVADKKALSTVVLSMSR